MPRTRTGTIEAHRWKDGRTVTYRARFPAYGRRWRIDFGTNHEGWSEQRARVELDRILAQVERGTWEPPDDATAGDGDSPDRNETVHVTASRWWERKQGEIAAKTREDYRWRIDHILRHLAKERTAALDARRVDRFRHQLRERGLSPRSVNMVLDLLAQVLDDAVEYGLLAANPARGRRRRLRVPQPPRTFLEPDMVIDLLNAAGEWERELPPHQRNGRRALLATLCLAGPRISEATGVLLRDLDVHGGRIRFASKTDAGHRDVELTVFLLDELRAHLAAMAALGRPTDPDRPVFRTRHGGHLNASNIRNRSSPRRSERANAKRADEGRRLLPERVTPHTLRRTFASLALAAGRDPRWVMAQIGHADARLTLSVYAQVVQRQRVDEQLVWELMRFPNERQRPAAALNSPTNSPTPPDPGRPTTATGTQRTVKLRMPTATTEDGRCPARTGDLLLVRQAL
jgi:integrase